MRRGLGVAFAAWAALTSLVCGARAELPRDYFLDAPAAGTFSHSDAYNVGAQQSIEYRGHLEEGMSMAHVRASGIVSYPYAEGSLNLDARVFLFTLGASGAYRQVYRDHTFLPGESRTRQARLDRESERNFGSQGYFWGEGRLRFVVPLDPFFMVNTGTIRWEDGNDNSFDWFHATVHDHGTLGKAESTLFWRHRDFGAVGPYVRWMSLPRMNADGESRRESELHYGFVLGTRPGFVRPRGGNADLFLLQAAFKFGDDEYGIHSYRIPAYLLAVYRATLKLW